jgi:putative ABC transport system permease protein
MSIVPSDIRQAVRSLSRSPGFALAAVLTLALGIGANSAIFSAVDAVLLRPIAAPELGRLVVLRADYGVAGLQDVEVSPGEALDLGRRSDIFEASAAYQARDLTVTGFGEPIRVPAVATLGQFFGIFGARPQQGRIFGPDASGAGEADVVVLSHAFWEQVSGGDPGFVGRTLELNGVPHEVIGVLAPGDGFPRQAQMWIPLRLSESVLSPEHRHSLYMTAVARLRPDATPAQVQSQLRGEVESWRERHGYPTDYRLNVVPLVDFLAGSMRNVLLVLLGAVGFVLLIACANVASLQLVRAASRSREMAIRAAIGARGSRLARQLLTEAALLAVVGGVLGIAFGYALLRVLGRLEVAQRFALDGVQLDARVVAFTAAVTIVAAALSGLVPALRASRVDLQQALQSTARGGSAGVGQTRLLSSSVVIQVGLALVLLVGSGLMIRSLGRILDTDPGFRAENTATMRIALPSARYSSGAERVAFFEALLRDVGAQPGIQSAGLISELPFSGRTNSSPFEIVGMPYQPGEPERHANLRVVQGDFFRAAGVPLLLGRSFEPADAPPGQLVAVIDERLANRFFPGQDPIGQQIDQGMVATVVGVVGTIKHGALDEADKEVVYYPQQHHPWVGSMSLVVRSSLPVETVAGMVRGVVRELDPALPVFEVGSLEQMVRQSVAPRSLAVTVLGAFAGLALLLAMIGLYGVVSYRIAQRTREIGIRVALGARTAGVIQLVVRQALTLTLVGVAFGVAAALALTRVLQSLLYGVSATDPATFVTVALLLVGVAALASLLPARRAARVDPIIALRAE